MKIILVLLFSVSVLIPPISALGQPERAVSCESPELKEFDFMPDEWQGVETQTAQSAKPLARGFTGESGLQKAGTGSAFDWIKRLAGEWEGSFRWSGARSGEGRMSAKYYLTGNGSAVVENLILSGQPSMTSVYHLDGSDLRMTHYCAAGNQPRLKASAIDDGKKSVHFDLVDVTNLASPSAGHVHRVELQLRDENHLTVIFTFRGGGSESYEHIELTRLSGKS